MVINLSAAGLMSCMEDTAAVSSSAKQTSCLVEDILVSKALDIPVEASKQSRLTNDLGIFREVCVVNIQFIRLAHTVWIAWITPRAPYQYQ